MKWKLTYKEVTLAIGILVAIIIMITLWVRPFSFEPEVSEKPAQSLVKPAAKILLQKAVVMVKRLK